MRREVGVISQCEREQEKGGGGEGCPEARARIVFQGPGLVTVNSKRRRGRGKREGGRDSGFERRKGERESE